MGSISGRRLLDWLCSSSSPFSVPPVAHQEGEGPMSPTWGPEAHSMALMLCSNLLEIGILQPLESDTGEDAFKVRGI